VPAPRLGAARHAQMQYSLVCRTIEDDVIPVCRRYGIGLLPWSPLGAASSPASTPRAPPRRGALRRRAPTELARRWRARILSERNLDIARTVAEVARELDSTPTAVSLAWLLGREAVTSVIIGPKSTAQLAENLAGAALALPPEQARALDAAAPRRSAIRSGSSPPARAPPGAAKPRPTRRPASRPHGGRTGREADPPRLLGRRSSRARGQPNHSTYAVGTNSARYQGWKRAAAPAQASRPRPPRRSRPGRSPQQPQRAEALGSRTVSERDASQPRSARPVDRSRATTSAERAAATPAGNRDPRRGCIHHAVTGTSKLPAMRSPPRRERLSAARPSGLSRPVADSRPSLATPPDRASQRATRPMRPGASTTARPAEDVALRHQAQKRESKLWSRWSPST